MNIYTPSKYASKLFGSSLIAATTLINVAHAAPEVYDVSFGYQDSKAKQSEFVVQYQNNQFKSTTQQIKMELGTGSVICEKYKDFKGAKLYLGPIWYVNNSIAVNAGTYEDSQVSVGVGIGKNDIVESTPLFFDINLAQVGKQVFDPAEIIADEYQKKTNQGMSPAQFLQNDRSVTVKRKVTLAGQCTGNNTNPGFGWEIEEKDVSFVVKYKGNPNLGNPKPGLGGNLDLKPKGPIVAVPLGGEGGFQQGKTNLKITHAQMLTNTLHYTGQCPANLGFSVQYKGLGEGKIIFMVYENNNQLIYESAPLDYAAADNYVTKNFFFNVPAQPNYINTKTNRSFKVRFKVRDVDADNFDWNAITSFDSLNWSHTCTPQAKFQMNNGNGGGINYNNPNPAPKPGNIQAQPMDPKPAAPMQIQPMQSTPEPQRPKRAQ